MEQKLLQAIDNRDLNAVNAVIDLIKEGVDIDIEDEDNQYNFVEHAILVESLDILKQLVENGASIHGDDDDALVVASEMGALDIVEYIFDIQQQEREEIFKDMDPEQLEEEIEDAEHKDAYRRKKAIEKASENDHYDVVYFLLINDVDPTYVDEDFVQKYYSPNKPENIIRLYNLHKNSVDISKLKGLTAKDIENLPLQFSLINETIKLVSQ